MSETPVKKSKKNSYRKKKAPSAPKHAEAIAEAVLDVDNEATPGDAKRRSSKRRDRDADDDRFDQLERPPAFRRVFLDDVPNVLPTYRFLGDRSTPIRRPVGRRIICDSHIGLFNVGDPYFYTDEWKIRDNGVYATLQSFGTGAVPDLHTFNSGKINLQSLQLQGRVFIDPNGGDMNYQGARDIHCSLFVIYDRSGFNILNDGEVPVFKDIYQIFWTHSLPAGDVIAAGNNCFLLNEDSTDRYRVLRRIDFVLEWRARYFVPEFKTYGTMVALGAVGLETAELDIYGDRITTPNTGYEAWTNNMLLKNRQRPITEYIDLQGLPSTYDRDYSGPAANWALPKTGQVFLAAYASMPDDMPAEFRVSFEMVCRLTATVKD